MHIHNFQHELKLRCKCNSGNLVKTSTQKSQKAKKVLGCVRDETNTKHIKKPLYKLMKLKISENFIQLDYQVSKW